METGKEGRGGLFARALGGSALTAGSFALMQALRLGSNLILTRLLFPEAFGTMALVSVVLVGLAMFSDMGVGPAIAQHRRGDDPAFLDTAFTLNILRGVLLWLLSCAIAFPAAAFYAAPELASLLPVAGLTLLVAGFQPTKVDTANRHLLVGRLTVLDLAAQIAGLLVMIVLAALLQSVWALVWGALAGALLKLGLVWRFLPGRANRLLWEREAAGDLLRFGIWIFLSTACGFLLAQGDKAILGAFLTREELGIYNIGFFLGSFPMLLAGAVNARIMIPLYRDHHPGNGPADRRRLARLRAGLTTVTLALLAAMALGGDALVGLLYDPRYAGAGAIVVAVALVQMPAVIGMTYDQSALAAGDSSRYFRLIALKAAVQTAAFMVGVAWGGLGGALLAQGLALTVLHLPIALLARQFGVWDARHDGVALAATVAIVLVALSFHGGWPLR